VIATLTARRAVAIAAAAVVVAVGASGCNGAARTGAIHLGAVQWRWRPPRPASVGMPAADGGGIVATFSHLFVVALTPAGTEQWRTRRLGVREEAPLLTPDLVVVPADDGLVALDRASGRIRWDTHLGGNVNVPDPDDAASSPALAGGTVVTTLSGGGLVALDLDSGMVRWRTRLAGRSEGPPATDGNVVVVTWDPEHGDGAGVGAYDAATGTRRWSARLHGGGVSAPAVAAGGQPTVVVVDDDLAAKGFDLVDGHRRWVTGVGSAGSPEVPPLPVRDGQVLVADRRAGLTLLDSAGHRRWTARGRGAAVRGGPAGPAAGIYALPLYDGTVELAGQRGATTVADAPGGLANGVAVGPGGVLLVSSAQGADNQLVAYRP
jgi:outer membrane protein assembly factor BamB